MYLQEDIKILLVNESNFDDELKDLNFNEFRSQNLKITSLQLKIIVCLAFGKSTHQIAEELQIDTKIVLAQKKILMRKLHVKTVHHIVAFAIANGLINTEQFKQ